MDKFVLHSEYKPTGDQPEAIDKLTKGVLAGDKEQVLLGVGQDLYNGEYNSQRK